MATRKGALLGLVAGAAAGNSVASILSPSMAERLQPGVLLPAFVGELALAVWLVANGVRVGVTDARGEAARA